LKKKKSESWEDISHGEETEAKKVGQLVCPVGPKGGKKGGVIKELSDPKDGGKVANQKRGEKSTMRKIARVARGKGGGKKRGIKKSDFA